MHPHTLTTADVADTCAPSVDRTPLFPPADADAETYRAWLARAAWPEVVFGARLPSAAPSQ